MQPHPRGEGVGYCGKLAPFQCWKSRRNLAAMPSEAESAVAAFFFASRKKKDPNGWQSDRVASAILDNVRRYRLLRALEHAAERDEWECGQE